MAQSQQLAALQAIESELTRIGSQLSPAGESPIDTSQSLVLLLHQAALLTSKAQVQSELGMSTEGMATASQAVSIANSLKSHARDDELRAKVATVLLNARTRLALNAIRSRNLISARDMLAQMRLDPANEQVVAKIEEALVDEESNRLHEFHNQVAMQAKEAVELRSHWTEAERALDTLAAEIAERVADAAAVFARVAHPERFQAWLVERIDANLLLLSGRSKVYLQPDVIRFVDDAVERGRRLQLEVFDSAEVLPASSISLGGQPGTDSTLRPYRQGGSVLGLPHPQDPERFAYPKWQFDRANGQVVRDVLEQLAGLSEWGKWKFFHAGLPALCELSPLQVLGLDGATGVERTRTHEVRNALLKGEPDLGRAVVAAAREFARGD